MGKSEYVTPSIAQFMRDMEWAWDAHQQALIKHRDLTAALARLAAEPAITHIPAMTGAAGRQAVERFYADQFPSGGPRCWPSPSSASSGCGSGPSGCCGITPR